MAQEIARGDPKVLAPLERFFEAVEYYNALFDELLPGAEGATEAQWGQLGLVLRQNIQNAKSAGDEAWRSYFPDRPVPPIKSEDGST
jgi:hypothetical protein